MKKIKNISILFLLILSLSSCKKIHTGKVVINENEKAKDEKLNIEYILVDEKDKDSLIKNIKSGKGAVIDRAKTTNNSDDKKDKKETEEKNNNTDER